MTLHPNTPKRIGAAAIATIAVAVVTALAAFKVITVEQSGAIDGVIASCAAVWQATSSSAPTEDPKQDSSAETPK